MATTSQRSRSYLRAVGQGLLGAVVLAGVLLALQIAVFAGFPELLHPLLFVLAVGAGLSVPLRQVLQSNRMEWLFALPTAFGVLCIGYAFVPSRVVCLPMLRGGPEVRSVLAPSFWRSLDVVIHGNHVAPGVPGISLAGPALCTYVIHSIALFGGVVLTTAGIAMFSITHRNQNGP